MTDSPNGPDDKEINWETEDFGGNGKISHKKYEDRYYVQHIESPALTYYEQFFVPHFSSPNSVFNVYFGKYRLQKKSF